MSYRSDTTVNLTIWIWTLVLIDNGKIILVSYFITLLSSWDTHKMLNVNPHVQIQICQWKLILQSFIQLECKFQYQWIMQRECQYHLEYICREVRYHELGECYINNADANISLRTDTTLLHLIECEYEYHWKMLRYFWHHIILIRSLLKILLTWVMSLHLSWYEYVVERRYYSH